MKLNTTPIIFFDTQTSGLRPPHGQILDFAWGVLGGEDWLVPPKSQQFKNESPLSKKISEITGWVDGDLKDMPKVDEWFQDVFLQTLKTFPTDTLTVIHGASFEKAFLSPFIPWPGDVLCTQSLIRQYFPDLPSANIRAVAGYFGHPIVGPNQAQKFVEATAAVWRGLIKKWTSLNIEMKDQLQARKAGKVSRSPRTKYHYRVSDLTRLNLPEAPGIYKMLSKNKDVLYVGKATSLKSRVNSYFRGRKNRDRKKLEMLAQVWTIDFEECRSPLEAALRETDEIKRLNPPYNISLKTNHRELVFYSRDFQSTDKVQGEHYPIGPFRQDNLIESLKRAFEGDQSGALEDVFYQPLENDLLREGLTIFKNKWPRVQWSMADFRTWLALASRLYWHFDGEDPVRPEDEPDPPTAESLAGKFERLFRRAGGEFARSRQITKSLNINLAYRFKGRELRLYLQQGELNFKCPPPNRAKKFPWASLNIETYDRLSILLSELKRLDHHILRQSEVETG